MFSEVTTRRSADAVFDQVASHIVGGELEPGTALPANVELATQLNVSRSVVREALNGWPKRVRRNPARRSNPRPRLP